MAQQPKRYVGYQHLIAQPITDALTGEIYAYEIEYEDGVKSWELRHKFENKYKPSGEMDMVAATIMLWRGFKMRRRGWNSQDQFIRLVPDTPSNMDCESYPEGTDVSYRPHIDIKDSQGMCAPWLASQADMLAQDWEVVE